MECVLAPRAGLWPGCLSLPPAPHAGKPGSKCRTRNTRTGCHPGSASAGDGNAVPPGQPLSALEIHPRQPSQGKPPCRCCTAGRDRCSGLPRDPGPAQVCRSMGISRRPCPRARGIDQKLPPMPSSDLRLLAPRHPVPAVLRLNKSASLLEHLIVGFRLSAKVAHNQKITKLKLAGSLEPGSRGHDITSVRSNNHLDPCQKAVTTGADRCARSWIRLAIGSTLVSRWHWPRSSAHGGHLPGLLDPRWLSPAAAGSPARSAAAAWRGPWSRPRWRYSRARRRACCSLA